MTKYSKINSEVERKYKNNSRRFNRACIKYHRMQIKKLKKINMGGAEMHLRFIKEIKALMKL